MITIKAGLKASTLLSPAQIKRGGTYKVAVCPVCPDLLGRVIIGCERQKFQQNCEMTLVGIDTTGAWWFSHNHAGLIEVDLVIEVKERP